MPINKRATELSDSGLKKHENIENNILEIVKDNRVFSDRASSGGALLSISS